MAGAGADGGAAMGVFLEGAGAGGAALGAILGGGEAARPRLGILVKGLVCKQEMLLRSLINILIGVNYSL